MRVSISLKHQQWSQYFAGEKETQPLFRKITIKYFFLWVDSIWWIFSALQATYKDHEGRHELCDSLTAALSRTQPLRAPDDAARSQRLLLQLFISWSDWMWSCSQTSSLVLFMVPWPCDVPLWRMLLPRGHTAKLSSRATAALTRSIGVKEPILHLSSGLCSSPCISAKQTRGISFFAGLQKAKKLCVKDNGQDDARRCHGEEPTPGGGCVNNEVVSQLSVTS